VRSENRRERGARLSNSWLLGLRATKLSFVLASTSGQLIDANGITVIKSNNKNIANHLGDVLIIVTALSENNSSATAFEYLRYSSIVLPH